MAAEQFACTRDGMLADLVVVDEQALVALPPHLGFEEAATLPRAGVTAWAALHGPRPVERGDTVLTVGTGGVALFALQFAKLAGARVVAVTSSEQKLETLERLGADVAIDASAHPEWDHLVREATDGLGVADAVETGGLTTLAKSLRSCRPEGDLALVAALGDGHLDVRELSAPVRIRRRYVGSRAHFQAMNDAITRGRMRPVVGRTFAFADAREAYRCAAARGHTGNIVIAP